MGTYGFVRFCLPLFPDATRTFVPWIAALALIGILYGALVALVQKDVKSLVAYSSVAHLGFVVLGLFALNAQGIAGATLQMVNHGLSTGALFLMVGMLYNRRHTRLLDDFGGLWKQIPIFGFLFVVVALSSAGLPGLNGFVGEFNILLGAFQTQQGVRRLRHARHHPGGLVPAVGHPPDAAGAADQAGERGGHGPELARGADPGADRRPVLRHRAVPEPVPGQDQSVGRGGGGCLAAAAGDFAWW